MTDIEYDGGVDDESMFVTDIEEDDDAEVEFDFEHLLPPDGAYEIVIKDLSFRDGRRESDGVRVFGLNIRVTLVDPGNEFDGTLLSRYIWLGNDEILPRGRKDLKGICDAVGVPCSGNVNIAEFQPVKQTIGNRQEKVLTVFSGLPCGAFTKIRENEYNGQTYDVCEPVAFITLERLAEIKGFNVGPEPY